MATADKNIQTINEPKTARLLRRLFCIAVMLFGAFTAVFGVLSILNAETIVETANQALADQEKTIRFGVTLVTVMCGVLALTGLMKLYIGIDALTGKRAKLLNALNIVNLILVIAVFVTIYNLNGGFTAVMIVNLIISIVMLCWLNARLARYLREMLGELKKLTWLTGKDLLSYTLAVLVFVLMMAVIIWLLDLAFSKGFSELAKIKIG